MTLLIYITTPILVFAIMYALLKYPYRKPKPRYPEARKPTRAELDRDLTYTSPEMEAVIRSLDEHERELGA